MENQATKEGENLDVAAWRGDLLERARAAPGTSGVYLMKDSRSEILYVGKAKSLKNRLMTYFQAAPHESLRTEILVHRIREFDVILTETESEALILEATLIKKHKPKFNVRLKDDKAYPYLKIRISERFPRIDWTRRVEKDGARYFGPFPSAWSARQVMGLLVETFKLRDCTDNSFRHRSRPCLLHQIGKCSGSCVGLVDEKTYREDIDRAVGVLEGKTEKLISELRTGMEDAARREEFEAAAFYRDQIRNLELITQTQGVVEAGSQRNRDVIGIARSGTEAHGTVLQIRGGSLLAVEHFRIQNADPLVPDASVLLDFLAQYYLKKDAGRSGASEVLVPFAPDEPDLLERTLGIRVLVADSAVDRQLLNVARANAEYALEQKGKRGMGHGVRALEEVQEKLHLPKLPHRIECYDVSNIQGEDPVASRVVFVDGAPDKNLYRRYKIRSVEGANDYAMMREVLGRRFSNEDEQLPDLVVVDGGKGQLAQAVAILDELSVPEVRAAGLAKARTERDFQSAEVKSSPERIFIPNRKNPVVLLPHTEAYKLLVHVRDEAHRFAISYHRHLRDKRSLDHSSKRSPK